MLFADALSVQVQFDQWQCRIGKGHRFAQRLLEHRAELLPRTGVALDVAAQHPVGFGLLQHSGGGRYRGRPVGSSARVSVAPWGISAESLARRRPLTFWEPPIMCGC